MQKEDYFIAYLLSAPFSVKRGLTFFSIDGENKKLILRVVREMWESKFTDTKPAQLIFVLSKSKTETVTIDLPAGYTEKEIINLTNPVLTKDGILMKHQGLLLIGKQKSKLICCELSPKLPFIKVDFDNQELEETGKGERTSLIQA